MSVDGCLDFLRVDLQSADVDHAAAPAQEIVPVAATLHHVARVDETFFVGKRGVVLADIAGSVSCRTDPKRTIDDFDVDVAGRADQTLWKSLETFINFETDAGFRRRERMDDAGVRIERTESIQDALVCDFSGQANVTRCDRTSVGAHQRTTPMGRCAGNVRRPMCTEPHEVMSKRLAGARKH